MMKLKHDRWNGVFPSFQDALPQALDFVDKEVSFCLAAIQYNFLTEIFSVKRELSIQEK